MRVAGALGAQSMILILFNTSASFGRRSVVSYSGPGPTRCPLTVNALAGLRWRHVPGSDPPCRTGPRQLAASRGVDSPLATDTVSGDTSTRDGFYRKPDAAPVASGTRPQGNGRASLPRRGRGGNR
jgi:hypothetical protein